MKGTKRWTVPVMLVLSLGAYVHEAAAAPSNVNACQTLSQPGSYVLAKNLAATGDCLVVAADAVTIDLAGFAITGNGTGSAVKSDGALRTGISIQNGTISNFATGIDFGFTGIQILVERMRISGNGNVGVGANDMAIVKDSLFFQNGDGINVGSRSVVTGNSSNFNAGSGIAVGLGSTVTGNTSNLNGNNGLVVGNGSTVVNNTTLGNGNFGLIVTCPGNVLGNTATQNGTNQLLQGAGCNVEHNLAP
jgi:hypothetical protein